MAEATFSLDKGEGKEYPVAFRGAEFRHSTLDQPTSETDWETVNRQLPEVFDDALSAYSLLAAAYNLDRQKAIKVLTGEEGATVESVQAKVNEPAFRKIRRRLRGMGGSGRKTSGTKRVPKAVAEATSNVSGNLQALLDDPNTPASVRAVLEQQIAQLQALGIQTPAATPAEAPKDAPKSNKNRK